MLEATWPIVVRLVYLLDVETLDGWPCAIWEDALGLHLMARRRYIIGLDRHLLFIVVIELLGRIFSDVVAERRVGRRLIGRRQLHIPD